MAFPQLSWRNHARFSGPVFDRPNGQPEEWQTLLQLAALVAGEDWRADVAAMDDAAVAADVQRLAAEHADAVLRALAPRRGPERLVDLALRSGPYGDQFGRKPGGLTLSQVQGAPCGIDLGELQARVPEVLRTPSGKIELAPPSCLADLAAVDAALGADAKTSRPRFSLIGRRDVRSGNSWMHNLPLLAKGPARCTLLVHPDDAASLGLPDGSSARLQSDQASLTVTIERSADMMPGVLSLPHGWGHDLPGARLGLAAERPGVNVNALLGSELRDPLSGNAVLSGIAVQLTAL
jgi:anaerobic selenocysteine-containing dehydrogenase